MSRESVTDVHTLDLPAAVAFVADGVAVTLESAGPVVLGDAVAVARYWLADLARAVSGADSELAGITAHGAELARTHPGTRLNVPVSAVLAAAIAAALRAERISGGLVRAARGPVLLDERARRLMLDVGSRLVLGESVVAWAADSVAAELTAAFGCGFLVTVDGAVAAAGTRPRGGWTIPVRDAAGRTIQLVGSAGMSFATVRGADRSGWRQVTCAGADAVQASAAASAAVILGERAPAWLDARGIPAALIGGDGGIVTVPGWPAVTAARIRSTAAGCTPYGAFRTG